MIKEKLKYGRENFMHKKCLLEDNKICDNCCECFVCDLDPKKVCDNCAKCLEDSDNNVFVIDNVLLFDERPGRGKKPASEKTKTGL